MNLRRGCIPRGWQLVAAALALLVVSNPGTPAWSGETADASAKGDADAGQWVAFPVIAYSPRTKLMLGAAVVHHFGSGEKTSVRDVGARGTKRSNVGVFTAVTLKQQFIAAIEPTLYLQGGLWRVSSALAALWFPDTFYALGPDSPESSQEKYTHKSWSIGGGAERVVWAALRAGMDLRLARVGLTDVVPGGQLASGIVPGSEGGAMVLITPRLAWDDRDFDYSPTRGSRHTLEFSWAPAGFLGDFRFVQATLNLNQYFLTRWGHVMAGQVYAQVADGQVPFQAMATLGDDGRMRGFFAGRYRDVHTLSTQIEYRLPLFWRVGMATFVGAGNVGSRLADLSPLSFRAVAGGGLRFLLNEKDRVHLRLDAGATSTGDVNFYFQMGEAF